jgi:hypothetical protein
VGRLGEVELAQTSLATSGATSTFEAARCGSLAGVADAMERTRPDRAVRPRPLAVEVQRDSLIASAPPRPRREAVTVAHPHESQRDGTRWRGRGA